MKFLLDANVVSALRVPGRNPAVESWVTRISLSDAFIAATTVAEIERGVVSKERTDGPQGLRLRRWFEDRVLPTFGGRILPFDCAAARVLATYRIPESAPLDDAQIAAIAHANGLTVATRNTKHFAPLGVPLINPWETPSS